MKEHTQKPLGKRIISGITSALMAITYGLSDYNHIEKVKADNIASDGAMVVTTPYESSIWYTGGPLGVAGDFHLFAFESLTNGNHINGNVATPVYNVNASMFASPNIEVGRLLSVITDEINWQAQFDSDWANNNAKYGNVMLNRLTDIFLPEDYEMYMAPQRVYDNMGNMTLLENTPVPYPTKLFGESSVVVYNGSKASSSYYMKISSNIHDDAYVAHASKDYFDWDALKEQYLALSDSYGDSA